MLEVVLITTIPRLAPAPFFSCGRLPELGLSLRTHFIHSFIVSAERFFGVWGKC